LEKIVIIGGGGHAKVLINVIKKSQLFEAYGYVDHNDRGILLGVNYLGSDDVLNDIFSQGIKYAAIGIGQVQVTQRRQEIVDRVREVGFKFPVIVSKDAIVNEDVLVGEGSQLFDGVVINSGTRIGNFSIINTKSTIEHDCTIGKYCHVATGAVISGGVEVGDFSMIGSNAVILQYKKIAPRTLIGSGGVVIKDITEPGKYVGNPVRMIA